jgi:uncharacterized membrane protein
MYLSTQSVAVFAQNVQYFMSVKLETGSFVVVEHFLLVSSDHNLEDLWSRRMTSQIEVKAKY